LARNFPATRRGASTTPKLLAQKLKDPEFCKSEGFPIGEDEDILALSDPPRYTACPNPWLADFIKGYGTPYDPKQPYHREPFAAGVGEGRTFHSLRHYKATQAYENLGKVELAKKLAEVLTIEQIAAMLGHSNPKTTKATFTSNCGTRDCGCFWVEHRLALAHLNL